MPYHSLYLYQMSRPSASEMQNQRIGNQPDPSITSAIRTVAGQSSDTAPPPPLASERVNRGPSLGGVAASSLERPKPYTRQEMKKKLQAWVTRGSEQERETRTEASRRILEAFDDKATSLDLTTLGLTELPEAIGQLTSLRKLDLSGNEITELPEAIGRLTSLEKLVLYKNQITELPEAIGQLTSLRELDLSGNQITELPEAIGQLTSLRELDLYKNQITELPEAIEKLTGLERLNLSQTQITEVPEAIGKLTRLRRLNLSQTQITEVPEAIGQLTSLRKLDLSGNEITELPEAIGGLTGLRELDLSHNQLTVVPDTIYNLPTDCLVDITSSGLSQNLSEQILERTQGAEYHGPRIYVSMQNARVDFGDQTAEELLASLFEGSNQEPRDLSNLLNDPDNKELLRRWLIRLGDVAENKSSALRRQELKKSILALLELAQDDPQFREVFFTSVKESLDTCGDRVAMYIVKLGIVRDLMTCDKTDLKALSTLILRGSWAFDQLQERARFKIEGLQGVDEIEVYLGYPMQCFTDENNVSIEGDNLKKRLGLQLHLDGMLYPRCSGLKNDDLQVAEDYIRSTLNNEQAIANILVTYPEWINALAAKYPSGFSAIEQEKNDALAVDSPDYTAIDLKYKNALAELTKQALLESKGGI